MNRVLLLSVRPRFAQSLLAGTKTAEIRRRFPDVPEGMSVVIYSSSPQKAVLGTMRARRLVRSNVVDIWQQYSDVIDIQQAELADYLAGASECSVLELDSPNVWSRPVPLEDLRRVLRVEPAQSFRYLTPKQLSRLEKLTEGLGVAGGDQAPRTVEVVPALA